VPRPRNEVYICDLSYHPGVKMVTRPPTTPECEPHEPWPAAYVAASDYADLMMETHDQRQCRGCGLWAIWTPKEKADA
jgi:hypothetical protein